MGPKGQRLEGAANPQPQGEPARRRDCQSSPGTTGAPRPRPSNRQQPEGIGSSCSCRDGGEGSVSLWLATFENGGGAYVAFGRNGAELPVYRHDSIRRTLVPMCLTFPGCFAIMPAARMTSCLRRVRLNSILGEYGTIIEDPRTTTQGVRSLRSSNQPLHGRNGAISPSFR